MLTRFSTMLSSLFGAALALAPPSGVGAKVEPPPANDACLDFVGYIELAEDKTIVVTYYPPVSATQRIRPRERVYPKYFAMLDKDRPAERRYLLKLDGTVSMAKDRSLRVEWQHGNKGDALSVPTIQILEPGAESYQTVIDRVRGLMPGETKGIPSRATTCPAAAAIP